MILHGFSQNYNLRLLASVKLKKKRLSIPFKSFFYNYKCWRKKYQQLYKVKIEVKLYCNTPAKLNRAVDILKRSFSKRCHGHMETKQGYALVCGILEEVSLNNRGKRKASRKFKIKCIYKIQLAPLWSFYLLSLRCTIDVIYDGLVENQPKLSVENAPSSTTVWTIESVTRCFLLMVHRALGSL